MNINQIGEDSSAVLGLLWLAY